MKHSIELLKSENVKIHIACAGSGAGIQQLLWQIPGSSSYLSGASFPYHTEETDELLGFKPENYSSVNTAIDMASAAYIKACSTSCKKKPVGLGLATSVASEVVHRGEHAIHACVITESSVMGFSKILDKGAGYDKRTEDGDTADHFGISLLVKAILGKVPYLWDNTFVTTDLTDQATKRFFERPLFLSNGKRKTTTELPKRFAVYPGSFSILHDGHTGMAESFEDSMSTPVLFFVTSTPPAGHKEPLSVQELLKRAAGIRGYNRLFSFTDSLYIDKARRFPDTPFIIGADTMDRILDSCWGPDVIPMLEEFLKLNTNFYVFGRVVNNKWLTVEDVLDEKIIPSKFRKLFIPMKGQWDVSSSELRKVI